jgi:ribosome biogenesis GTPase / thiamine phosphate phosphatase
LSQSDSQLTSLGWDPNFEEKFKQIAGPREVPARVLADFAAEYLLHDGMQTLRATARHVDPAVGDWVSVEGDAIKGIVERRTLFARQSPGTETRQQVLAANVDVTFVVAAATDVNARRIERYLTAAWQSGAMPVVVVTKADLLDSPDELLSELESAAAGSPIALTSSVSGAGLDQITRHLRPNRTGVLLGPSGAGKSTLINTIVGAEVMRTREIHGLSGEGRHMTSHRQLVQLPGGGMIIDTPGLREAQLWEGEDALAAVFDDIEELARRCRFNDCAHRTEPGCAIRGALDGGSLDAGRFESYRKLQRELRAIAARSDARLKADERRKWKQIAVANRARDRYSRR